MTRMYWRLAVSSALIAGFAGAEASGLEITVLSSAPHLVSGNEALVQVNGATAAPSVTINGRALRVDFKVDPNDPAKQVGLVNNVRLGKNDLVVTSGRDRASLTLIGHDINGSLFAGPQDAPFLCELDAHGLKPTVTTQLDPWRANCAAAPQIAYYYRDTAGEWKPFDATGPRPTDIGKGAQGQDMIIRQEIGVINRAAYVITIPHDPAAGPTPTPTDRGGSSWNGKLLYSFGPGARGDGHHQGRGKGQLGEADRFTGSNGTWYIDNGYAIASSSLNSFGTSTDAVVSAESAYKVKERFIEQFGVPMFTVGNGASGGSMQQNIIANAYPGLLDGIVPGVLYADGMTFFQPLYDCELLVNVFKEGEWTREQLDAVSGKYWGFCVSNGTRYPTQQVENCDTAVLEMVDKDPSVAMEDVRCTFQDDLKQVFGVDPKTGYARSPWDNVGVQYGLQALNDGVISFEQFIDINKRIGGHDINGKIVPDRQVGDVEAIRAAYATGQINRTDGGYADIPVLGIRVWRDGDPFNRGDANVDVHDGYHSRILQERLMKAHGNANNYVQLYYGSVGAARGADNAPDSAQSIALDEGLPALDAWMTAIAMDKSDTPKAQKVAAHKPAGLVDACWSIDGKPYKDEGAAGKVEKITDWSKCQQIFANRTDARIVAGGPMTSDVLKCQLKPIDAADYKVAPNAEQMAALKAAFPDGVCDWTKPGVGQDEPLTTWAAFNDHGGWEKLALN